MASAHTGVDDSGPQRRMLNLVFKGFRAAKLEDKLPLASNLIVSNVPGPPLQLYMAGAKAELDRLLAASGWVAPAPKTDAPAAKQKADAAVPPGGSSSGSAE